MGDHFGVPMTENPKHPQLAPVIRSTLDALRRRVRGYIWLEGLAEGALWLGVSFWISLAVDWFFEPSPFVRGVILTAAVLGLLAVFWFMIARRVLVPLSYSNLAMLLERRFPQFHDGLLTAVALCDPASGADYNAHLLARTCRQAEGPVREVSFSRVFNRGPLRRRLGAAAALLLSVLGFALARPDLASVWARRAVLFSDELWPRSTRLVIEGFDGGVARVARGSDLEITVKADLGMPVVPDVVAVRYRSERGARKLMSRVGAADPDRDQYQEYSYTFRGVLTPIEFDVVGGDALLSGLKIEVVENPTIVEMILDCEFPAYMGRSLQSLAVTGPMQVPVGSRITVRARSNKDLVRVTVESALEEPPKPPVQFRPHNEDRRSFQYAVGPLVKDKTLLFTLFDTDGIRSREPVRLSLAAVEDQRPELAVQLRGIGAAVTPQASIPAVGRVGDDYGIARIWFEYTIDKQEPKIQPIASPPGNATEFTLKRALDVRPLGLKPGGKLLLAVKAEDRCDLASRPNVGTSDRWLLDVVTPEQLRAMLQSRELVLRQRFEGVIKDVTDARDGLARIDFSPPASPTKPAAAGTGRMPVAPVTAKGAEPGDAPDAQADRSPQRLLAQRTLQAQWAQQNCRKEAHETASLADSFADIREELVNNRIDTEELKLRLEGGIAKPLRRIAEEMFPELDRRLDRLQADLADPAAGSEAQKAAVAQVDAILLAMRQVLGRMIELEDFNEAVELLKSIIQSEQKLRDETQKRHKEKLRELLEK
jgi:hypothetical protein